MQYPEAAQDLETLARLAYEVHDQLFLFFLSNPIFDRVGNRLNCTKANELGAKGQEVLRKLGLLDGILKQQLEDARKSIRKPVKAAAEDIKKGEYLQDDLDIVADYILSQTGEASR